MKKTHKSTPTTIKKRTPRQIRKAITSLTSRRRYREMDEYVITRLRNWEEKAFPDTSVRKFKIKECAYLTPEFSLATWLCTALFELRPTQYGQFGIVKDGENTYAACLPFTSVLQEYITQLFPDREDESLAALVRKFITDTEILEIVGYDDRYGIGLNRQIVVKVPDELKAVLKKMPIRARKEVVKAKKSARPRKVDKLMMEYVKPVEDVDIQGMREYIIDHLHEYGIKKLLRFTTIAQRIERGDLKLNVAKTDRCYYNAENLPKAIRNVLFRGKYEIDISSAHLTIFKSLTGCKVDHKTVYDTVAYRLNITRSQAKIIVNSLLNGMKPATAHRRLLAWDVDPVHAAELMNVPELREILSLRSKETAKKLQKIEAECMKSAVVALGYMTHWLHDAVILRSENDCKRFEEFLNLYAAKYFIRFDTKTTQLL